MKGIERGCAHVHTLNTREIVEEETMAPPASVAREQRVDR